VHPKHGAHAAAVSSQGLVSPVAAIEGGFTSTEHAVREYLEAKVGAADQHWVAGMESAREGIENALRKKVNSLHDQLGALKERVLSVKAVDAPDMHALYHKLEKRMHDYDVSLGLIKGLREVGDATRRAYVEANPNRIWHGK
jgi:hypothetical protein